MRSGALHMGAPTSLVGALLRGSIGAVAAGVTTRRTTVAVIKCKEVKAALSKQVP